jgi:hypothetical protein
MTERIVRYTPEELRKMKGESDWGKIDRTTDEEIDKQAENDPDLVVPTEEELAKFKLAKKIIHVRDEENEK